MNGEFNGLIKQALSYYDLFQDSEDVIKGAYPILYFGDYEEYITSKIKIITVGLNPSQAEFPNDHQYKRFPKIDSQNLQEFFGAYNHYFKKDLGRDPYSSWFNSNEKVLNGIKSSYFKKEGHPFRALHTDICTPLATDPTWSQLSDDFKLDLMKEGVKIWHGLVQILRPDAIICSFAKKLRNEIKFDFVEGWQEFHSINSTKAGRPRKPYKVEKMKIRIQDGFSYVFWGAQANKPFGNVSDKDKNEIGNHILKVLTENNG